MAQYSKDFKETVVQAFLARGSKSCKQISQEFGVALSTIYVWLGAVNFELDEDSQERLSPEQWPPSKRMQAISIFDTLSDEERGEFLRNTGITTSHVEKWRKMLYSALEARDQEKQKLEKKIKYLEREVARKEKALAEAAALLILQKKAHQLFKLEE